MACRQSLPKHEMLRLVVDGDGLIWPDLLQKAPGRGVYHCMSEACLVRMNDKRLQALKAHFKIILPQYSALLLRIESVLQQQLARMCSLQRACAAIGRDAVMHRLWNNAPLLLLRAADAGDALVRQIDDGLGKRAAAGRRSELVDVASRQWLGELFGRDDVAVVVLDAAGAAASTAERLRKYCVWHGRIQIVTMRIGHESKVSG